MKEVRLCNRGDVLLFSSSQVSTFSLQNKIYSLKVLHLVRVRHFYLEMFTLENRKGQEKNEKGIKIGKNTNIKVGNKSQKVTFKMKICTYLFVLPKYDYLYSGVM